MEPKPYFHSGFEFLLQEEVTPALVLTHLVGKDLRTAERLLDRFFLDLLLASQDRFGDQLSLASKSIEFQVEGDSNLRIHLSQALNGVRQPAYLVSIDPKIEALVRRLLPLGMDELKVVGSPEGLRSAPPGCLVVLDALDRPEEEAMVLPVGLDHMVVRVIVDSRITCAADPWLKDQCIPIRTNSRNGIARDQVCAAWALKEAIERACFSRYFERCRASHLRWRTHLELNLQPGGQIVQAKICFDGEDRVMQAKDLKKEIAWAEIPSLRFSDVLGLHAAKDKLQEYVEWLRDPYGEVGIQACVLSGPPGTGKTHSCLATAGEANVPCIVVGGAEFLKMYYGETERVIRETFAGLRQYEAAILVVDEFDAIAWRRDQSNEWRAQDQSQIVGELLRSVDLLRNGPGRVLLLATTNQYERIDPALVRSLRMGERIHLGLPTSEDRGAMLQGLLKDLLQESEQEELVEMSMGLSAADLSALVDRARKLAARAGESLAFTHLRAAVFEFRRGEVNGSLCLDSRTKRRLAFHEAGHALLAYQLLGPGSIEHVSVIPAVSGPLGATYRRRSESVDLLDREGIERQLAVLLAGRVAEGLSHPETGPSCGAESDLQEATRMAQQAIGAWGLDPEFPLLSMEALPISLQHALSSHLLERIQHWIQRAEELARTELTRNQERLEALALRLAEAETLHRADLLTLLE
jgi:cell division protease FtsH